MESRASCLFGADFSGIFARPLTKNNREGDCDNRERHSQEQGKVAAPTAIAGTNPGRCVAREGHRPNRIRQVQYPSPAQVIAAQIAEAMKQKGLTKTAMAEQMETTRAQLDRLLDPDNDSVTLATLKRAAKTLGKTLRLELAEPDRVHKHRNRHVCAP